MSEIRVSRWLFKTEPSTYEFEDLVRDGRTAWDGITNALALQHLRTVRKGDSVLVYHTGDVKAAVGLAKVAKGAYPDPRSGDARLVVVDLVPDRALGRPVALANMRATRALAGFDLLRNSRLSVVPVSETQWKTILSMSTE